MGAMKRTILALIVLLAGTAPASAAFFGANSPLGESFLNTGIEKVAGDVSLEVPMGYGGAWLKSAAECFVAPIKYQSPAIGPKIQSQIGPRGWTPQLIDEAVQGGRQIPAINRATGNPAIRYVHPITGQSVVVDRVTGEVIHVGGPGFLYGPGAGDVPLLPPPGR